jgi:hypothetical protein
LLCAAAVSVVAPGWRCRRALRLKVAMTGCHDLLSPYSCLFARIRHKFDSCPIAGQNRIQVGGIEVK